MHGLRQWKGSSRMNLSARTWTTFSQSKLPILRRYVFNSFSNWGLFLYIHDMSLVPASHISREWFWIWRWELSVQLLQLRWRWLWKWAWSLLGLLLCQGCPRPFQMVVWKSGPLSPSLENGQGLPHSPWCILNILSFALKIVTYNLFFDSFISCCWVHFQQRASSTLACSEPAFGPVNTCSSLPWVLG